IGSVQGYFDLESMRHLECHIASDRFDETDETLGVKLCFELSDEALGAKSGVFGWIRVSAKVRV
ncbi:hypothetical protein J1N35_023341, partial [Gossypium stocksii]